jgi:hypothetical protein
VGSLCLSGQRGREGKGREGGLGVRSLVQGKWEFDERKEE